MKILNKKALRYSFVLWFERLKLDFITPYTHCRRHTLVCTKIPHRNFTLRFNLILLTLFVLILIGFQSCAQNDCDCWKNEFMGQEVNYETSVEEMEKSFIAKGYLKDEEPASYIQLMDSIIFKNEYFLFDVEYNPILTSEFEKCFLANTCNKATYEKIGTMSDILLHYNNVSPRQTFSDFKRIFDIADFKEIEVKHYFLTFYNASFLQVHSGLPMRNESNGEVETYKPLAKRNILKIYVAANDSIFVNEHYVAFQNLRQRVINHVSDTTNSENSPEIITIDIEGLGKRKVSKQVISFLIHRSASYDLYKKVQNELTTAYIDVRNEIGLMEFGMSYEKMLEQSDEYEKEIKIVRQLLPQRISESEPIDE